MAYRSRLWRWVPFGAGGRELRRTNEQLHAALQRERAQVAELVRAREHLERHSSQLTVRHRRIQSGIRGSKTFFVHWAIASGEIYWDVGFVEVARSVELSPETQFHYWTDLIGEDHSARLLSACAAAIGSKRTIRERLPVDLPGFTGAVLVIATPDPPIQGHAGSMTGSVALMPE